MPRLSPSAGSKPGLLPHFLPSHLAPHAGAVPSGGRDCTQGGGGSVPHPPEPLRERDRRHRQVLGDGGQISPTVGLEHVAPLNVGEKKEKETEKEKRRRKGRRRSGRRQVWPGGQLARAAQAARALADRNACGRGARRMQSSNCWAGGGAACPEFFPRVARASAHRTMPRPPRTDPGRHVSRQGREQSAPNFGTGPSGSGK